MLNVDYVGEQTVPDGITSAGVTGVQMKKKTSHSDISRREFIGNHGLLVTIVAFMCGIKLDAAIVPTVNVGFKLDRLRWQDATGMMERALSEAWAHENDETRGNGTLQTLMWQSAREEPGLDPVLTERERRIAAMVIQWLATNCGRSFLFEASRRMGKEHECYPFHNIKAYWESSSLKYRADAHSYEI